MKRLIGSVRYPIETMAIPYTFWYLATPYAKWPGGRDDAFAHAAALAGRILKKGIGVFSPIAHSHPLHINAPSLPDDHDFWLDFDKRFVDVAHGGFVADLPGWEESRGVTQEIEWFQKAGKPLMLLDPVTLDCRAMRA